MYFHRLSLYRVLRDSVMVESVATPAPATDAAAIAEAEKRVGSKKEE